MVGFCLSMIQDDPQKVFRQRMEKPGGGSLANLTLQMAQSFLGTAYVSHTLEGNPTEQLVCRFDGLDCTTLVETSVALAVAKKHHMKYDGFRQELTQLRYRHGQINGYASRLHYFVDWLYHNQQRGRVEDITARLGGIPYHKNIHFMTSHAELYPALSSEETWRELKLIEEEINARAHYYIPQVEVRKVEPLLKEGDIVGITSSVEGLDCNHQGIITKIGERAFLVHASTDAKKVILSPRPLAEYVASIKRHTGIIVLRIPDE
ncbi:hypothetical protein HNQ92_001464 [Rhabdobacter roseus]|uniref:DUF1460 domain-containing protein n=1 Tax=Rhabdobacter roseus TaxID=1655419 RepID=A0A840TTI1_9BACT|nr:N-acetylmuramoyl-L-alanine amidase-like domain-containing protein [Rhabdobacter roseus]MBB5283338.1 hypothetical protein [Rhabdobacter roseus]